MSDYPKATAEFLDMLPSDKCIIVRSWYEQATENARKLFDISVDQFMQHKRAIDLLLSGITEKVALRSIQ